MKFDIIYMVLLTANVLFAKLYPNLQDRDGLKGIELMKKTGCSCAHIFSTSCISRRYVTRSSVLLDGTFA